MSKHFNAQIMKAENSKGGHTLLHNFPTLDKGLSDDLQQSKRKWKQELGNGIPKWPLTSLQNVKVFVWILANEKALMINLEIILIPIEMRIMNIIH